MAKVYVICDNDCKYESMTKEQIIAAIAEATGYVPSGEDDAFISRVLEGNRGLSLSFWLGTQAQFNELGVDAPTYALKVDESGKVYLTPASEMVIPDGSITAEKLAENAITSDKVSKGAITKDKLASEVIKEISDAKTAGENAAKSCLPLNGGAMNGAITTKGIQLTKNEDYFDAMPEDISTMPEGKLVFIKAV